MSAKRLAWFATENGKKWVLIGINCTGAGLLFANVLPHTILMYKYKEIVQLYRLGINSPVATNVVKLVDQVMEEMNVTDLHKKMIAPFTVFGFDIFHAGSTTSKFGAILGIPSNFAYESTEDVDRQNILVKNELIDWTTRAGKELQSALVLSEKAKKFAIAREIVSCQTLQPFLNGIFPISVLLLVYSFTHTLNKRLQLFARPVAMRGVLYTISGLFGFGSWAFMKDYATIYYETAADRKICSIGKDYVQGGVEFYKKTLQRNMALRELMGKDGEKLYSVSGNEAFFIRQKRLPIGFRKLFMEQKLKELLNTTHEDYSADEIEVKNPL